VHNAPSTSFSISSRFNAKYKLGLSATPERNDGLTHVIYLFFGDSCYVGKYSKDDEDILPVLVKIHNIYDVEFNPVCVPVYDKSKSVGDAKYLSRYALKKTKKAHILEREKDEKLLKDISYNLRPRISYHKIENEVILHEEFGNNVMEILLEEFNLGRSIVVFITQKEHCEIYYENIAEMIGEENVQLFYGDSKDSNEELMRRAEEKEVMVTVTTLKKSTEGTNIKSWEVAFLVSSINNGKGVEQAIGRIRRTKEGKISPCIVHDFRFPSVYGMSNHGVTRDKRYSQMHCEVEGLKTKHQFQV
jgi:superfamily II DNA or RNA helicase